MFMFVLLSLHDLLWRYMVNSPPSSDYAVFQRIFCFYILFSVDFQWCCSCNSQRNRAVLEGGEGGGGGL